MRKIDVLITKYVLKVKMAQDSEEHQESFLEGWLDNQNFYSTRIEDAWKIIEHVEKDFEVEIHIEKGMMNVILTERFESGHLKNTYQGYEKSAPLAICKAALRSVGIETHKGKAYQVIQVK